MQKVRALMIVEIAGRPAEHVKATLENHVGLIKNFKDIETINIKISEPKEIEGHKDLFTCFAEVEFEAENLARVTDMIFDFMPSSIEILEPSHVSLEANEATGFLNTLSGRLHKYDEIAKIASLQNQKLFKKLHELEQKGLVEVKRVDRNELKRKTSEKKTEKKKKTGKGAKEKKGKKK